VAAKDQGFQPIESSFELVQLQRSSQAGALLPPQGQVAMASEVGKFLPALVKAMRAAHAQGTDLSTQSFNELMQQVVLIFDYLGTVLHFAKHDMETKIQSLHAAAPTMPQLRQVIEADVAAGNATVKDSCARNTHRLLCVLAFMRVLLEHLAKGPQVSLKDAASAAYEQVCALSKIPFGTQASSTCNMHACPTCACPQPVTDMLANMALHILQVLCAWQLALCAGLGEANGIPICFAATAYVFCMHNPQLHLHPCTLLDVASQCCRH
jgi:hypothetical protein